MSDILAVDVGGTVTNLLDRSLNIGAKIIAFLVIFLIGWLISRLLYRLADKLLDRVGFNRLAERSGLRRWTGQYRPSDLLAKIIYYGLLLVTLQLAFSVFGPNPISDLLDAIVGWLPQLLVACVIVVVAAAIGSALFDIIHNALGALSYGRLLARIVQILVLVLGAFAALNQVGIATTVTMPVLIAGLAAIAGIAIVGIGGGMIRPMTQRWERMLNHAEAEGGKVREQLRTRASERQQEGEGTFGQPSYQGRTGGQAAQDVQRAADRAAQEARDAREGAEQGNPGM